MDYIDEDFYISGKYLTPLNKEREVLLSFNTHLEIVLTQPYSRTNLSIKINENEKITHSTANCRIKLIYTL